jgi:hypothetical protein
MRTFPVWLEHVPHFHELLSALDDADSNLGKPGQARGLLQLLLLLLLPTHTSPIGAAYRQAAAELC